MSARLQARLVAAALDPGGGAELVEQLRELPRRRVDHLHVVLLRLAEIAHPDRSSARSRGSSRAASADRARRARRGAESWSPAAATGRRDTNLSAWPSRDHLLDDLQASAPEVRLGLSRAGVQGVEKAIRLRWGGAEKLISARDRLQRRPRPGARRASTCRASPRCSRRRSTRSCSRRRSSSRSSPSTSRGGSSRDRRPAAPRFASPRAIRSRAGRRSPGSRRRR